MSSILTDTKKVLGIAEDYTAFDTDIVMHINSVFSTLNQLGIGPVNGFMIESKDNDWDDFTKDTNLNPIRSYIYLRVKILFDPSGTSFVLESMKEQIKELEWRLNVHREDTAWTSPTTRI